MYSVSRWIFDVCRCLLQNESRRIHWSASSSSIDRINSLSSSSSYKKSRHLFGEFCGWVNVYEWMQNLMIPYRIWKVPQHRDQQLVRIVGDMPLDKNCLNTENMQLITFFSYIFIENFLLENTLMWRIHKEPFCLVIKRILTWIQAP